jgi:hypothetical protein
MRKIPEKLRAEMSVDPYYKICAREDEECSGRITWEHSIIFAGKQLNEKWAILPLCEYHHLYGGLNKEMNEYIALNRATDEELRSISKAVDYLHKRNYLNSKYNL